MHLLTPNDFSALDFDKTGGLVPVIAQHARTGEVLMMAYADREALERSLQSGDMHFWSRSREALWRKGETSGNTLRLIALHADCDRDAVLARVLPAGPTCHTGEWSCFGAPPTLPALDRVLASRRGADAGSSYTARLLSDRNLRLKKLGEEAVELAVACADGDRERAAEEAADLIYHVMAACLAEGVTGDSILERLDRRLPAAHQQAESDQ